MTDASKDTIVRLAEALPLDERMKAVAEILRSIPGQVKAELDEYLRKAADAARNDPDSAVLTHDEDEDTIEAQSKVVFRVANVPRVEPGPAELREQAEIQRIAELKRSRGKKRKRRMTLGDIKRAKKRRRRNSKFVSGGAPGSGKRR